MDRNEIWIFAECTDGQLDDSYCQLLSAGRSIAEKMQKKLCAVLTGIETKQAEEQIRRLGVDRIYIARLTGTSFCTDNDIGAALCHLAKERTPDTVLFPASDLGRSAASRLAVFKNTGLTADCSALSVRSDGTVVWECPSADSGFVRIICEKKRPQMATLLPGHFLKAEPDPSEPEVLREDLDLTQKQSRILQVEPAVSAPNRLSSAELIIGGGNGMGSQENFRLLERLAELLDGALGATRAAVDEGWAEQAQMIGQSGICIAPKVYIAFGISGYAQHMTGISDDTCIIAINSDPDAPIFRYARYGIVGDAAEIASAWLSRLEV